MSQVTIGSAPGRAWGLGWSPARLRLILLGQYGLFGSVVGLQSVLWSDVKAGIGLGEGVFGTAMMLTPLVGFVALSAGIPWQRLGQRRLATAGLLAIAGSVLILALARDLGLLLISRALAGLGFALLESGANSAALSWEAERGRGLMGLLYALFSIGMVAGALAGGALIEAGLGYRAALTLLVPGLLLAAAATSLTSYPPERPAPGRAAVGAQGGQARRELLILAGIALMAVAGEAVADVWGVIHLRALGAEALASSVMFALFNSAMILGRLVNGPLLARWGAQALLRWACAGVAGAAALLATGALPLSLAAFSLLELAVAGVVPTLLTIVRTRRPDGDDAMVSGVVAATYLGFVVTSPIVGWLAELWGLQLTLPAVLAVIAGAMALLARRV